MKLHILFMQRAEKYEGEYAPEALIVWDEYGVDENPIGWHEACAKEVKELDNGEHSFRVIEVNVSQDRIRDLLLHNPGVMGLVE